MKKKLYKRIVAVTLAAMTIAGSAVFIGRSARTKAGDGSEIGTSYYDKAMIAEYNDGNIDVKGSDIILIMLGTNGGLDPDKDVQGNAEYLEIINKCKTDAPDAKIVLCTPPHATENPSMSNCGYAQRVNNAVAWTRKTAQKLGLYLVDVADCKEFCAENESKYQPNDGLHFSKEGYEVLAKYIFDALKKERLL